MVTLPRASFLALAFVGFFVGNPALSGQGLELTGHGTTLTLGARVHSLFVHSSAEGGPSAEFLVRRARLKLDLEFNELVDGRIQHDFLLGLQDAFLRLNFDPAFRLSAGQFKRGFDLFELLSTSYISVVERAGDIRGLSTCEGPGGICSYSRFSEALQYSARDIGLRAEGQMGPVSYLATLTNGAGLNARENNDTKSVAGRAAISLSEGLTLGGGFSVHDYPREDGGGNGFGSAFATDLEVGHYLTPGPHLQAGIMSGDNWKAGENVSFLTGQIVYMHYVPLGSDGGTVAAVEPVARISWGDPDRDRSADDGVLLTPGLMVYLQDRIRVGTSLDIWDPNQGDTELSFKIQTYLWF